MATEYVTYSNGLRPIGHGEDDEPLEVGTVVAKGDFEPEEWDYHIQHGAIVRKGGPNDPEVLAAALEPEEVDETSEDPRDTEIRQLREALALYVGRGTTPAASSHLGDLAAAEAEDVAEAEEEKKVASKPASKPAENKQ